MQEILFSLPVIECHAPSHSLLFISGINLEVIEPAPLSAVNHSCKKGKLIVIGIRKYFYDQLTHFKYL